MIDFLGIGAQKAGTSWMMRNLRRHPDVWSPFTKEIHYFDTVHLHTREKDTYLTVLRKKADRVNRTKRRKNGKLAINRDYLNRILDPDFALTDAWYAHIFSPAAPGLAKGEFTPLYCAIGSAGVAHVRQLLPAVRLIYGIRDPVERALSSIRMSVDRNANLDIGALITTRHLHLRGDYASHIPVWDAAYPEGQVLYVPFGRIRHDPLGVMRAMEKHIGLAPFDGYPRLTSPVHVTSKSTTFDDSMIRRLREIYEPQYAFLERRFGKSFLLETQ